MIVSAEVYSYEREESFFHLKEFFCILQIQNSNDTKKFKRVQYTPNQENLLKEEDQQNKEDLVLEKSDLFGFQVVEEENQRNCAQLLEVCLQYIQGKTKKPKSSTVIGKILSLLGLKTLKMYTDFKYFYQHFDAINNHTFKGAQIVIEQFYKIFTSKNESYENLQNEKILFLSIKYFINKLIEGFKKFIKNQNDPLKDLKENIGIFGKPIKKFIKKVAKSILKLRTRHKTNENATNALTDIKNYVGQKLSLFQIFLTEIGNKTAKAFSKLEDIEDFFKQIWLKIKNCDLFQNIKVKAQQTLKKIKQILKEIKSGENGEKWVKLVKQCWQILDRVFAYFKCGVKLLNNIFKVYYHECTKLEWSDFSCMMFNVMIAVMGVVEFEIKNIKQNLKIWKVIRLFLQLILPLIVGFVKN